MPAAPPLCLGPGYRPRVLAAGRLAHVRSRTLLALRPAFNADSRISTLHWRLIVVAEGTAETDDGQRLAEGEALLIAPGSTGGLQLAPRTRLLHLLFDVVPRRIDWRELHPLSRDDQPQPGARATWGVELPQRLPPAMARAVRALIQRLRTEVGRSIVANLRADARLALLLADLVAAATGRGAPAAVPGAGGGTRMARILALAAALVGGNGRATVVDLAQQADLSLRQLQREFATAALPPPRAWMERLRLERAARELTGGDEPVRAIARRNGYRSDAAFTRAFARVMGVGPQRWRRQR